MVDPHARARHHALMRELEQHLHAYHVLDAPTISDAEYDGLYQELLALEAAHPELVTPHSPSQRVGSAPLSTLPKLKRAVRMYSLDNAYSEADLRAFDERVRTGLGAEGAVTYVTEPKLDGASIEVVYEGGRLLQASTRGDGETGEDVTANIRTIRSLPLTIDHPTRLTLRGEVVIRREDLAQVNELRASRGEELFANPRNAAAGSLRLIDPKLTAERPLRVIFYDTVEPLAQAHAETLKAVKRLGLPTHGRERVCHGIEAVLAFIDEFERARFDLPYDTDGVVIKLNDLNERKNLGTTSRFPRWATAYKFAAERKETVVLSISADLGRTGTLTPVAELTPIKLSGTTVSRASLHNLDYIAAKDVRVGDTVSVEKAGEIIPQVIEVNLALRPPGTESWQPPTRCPACTAKLKRVEGEAALRCPNSACPGRLKAAVFYFTRRSGMDVDGLGRALIEQLVETGLLTSVADVFTLADKRPALLALERVGEKSVDNLLASIERARTGRSFDRLLTALGIPLVGSVAARQIAEKYGNLGTLLAAGSATTNTALVGTGAVAGSASGTANATATMTDPHAGTAIESDLSEIAGIGPKIASSVAAYVADPSQRAVLERLLALGVRAETARVEKITGPLTGTSFCVTGTLSEPRETIHAEILARGGEVHTAVKKGTTYLVAGDKVGKAKLDAAQKKGAEVIDEARLRILLSM